MVVTRGLQRKRYSRPNLYYLHFFFCLDEMGYSRALQDGFVIGWLSLHERMCVVEKELFNGTYAMTDSNPDLANI